MTRKSSAHFDSKDCLCFFHLGDVSDREHGNSTKSLPSGPSFHSITPSVWAKPISQPPPLIPTTIRSTLPYRPNPKQHLLARNTARHRARSRRRERRRPGDHPLPVLLLGPSKRIPQRNQRCVRGRAVRRAAHATGPRHG